MDKDKLAELLSTYELLISVDSAEQASHLEQITERDPALAQQLTLMMQANQDQSPLDQPILRAHAPFSEGDTLSTGNADYQISELVATGGHGRVYRAIREIGELEQTVAIKQLISGKHDFAIQLFRRESALLASLNHHGIALFIDSFVDDTPCMVMQWVDGQPIDRHVDVHQMGTHEIIDLIIQLCDAVSHAHSRRILHRDIKPANILIESDGHLKLVDFGIASDSFSYDHADGMTPEYASPEQQSGHQLTTASDIWSIGKVLKACLDRRSQSKGQSRPLASDLKLIIDSACHRDPEQRFVSAAAMASELGRFRGGLPLTIRPQGGTYRMRKWIGRHRLASALIGLASLTVLIYSALLVRQYGQTLTALESAQAERRIAAEIAEFMTSVFQTADPMGINRPTTDTLLANASDRIDNLTADSDVRDRLYLSLARVNINLADFTTAATLIDRISDPDSLDDRSRVRLMMAESALLRHGGEASQALKALEQAHELAQNWTLTDGDRRKLLYLSGVLERDLGHVDRAIGWQQQLTTTAPGNDDIHSANASLQLASLHWMNGDYEQAEHGYLAALERHQQLLPDSHPFLANSRIGLSILAHRRGDYETAEQYARVALEIQRSSLGPSHPLTARTHNNLGAIYLDSGDAESAAGQLNQALAIQQAMTPVPRIALVNTLNNLGLALMRDQKPDAAISQFRQAIDIGREVWPDGHTQLMSVEDNLALALKATGEIDAACTLIDRVAEERFRELGQNHFHSAYSAMHKGQCAMHRLDWPDALNWFRQAWSSRLELLGADHELTRLAELSMREVLIDHPELCEKSDNHGDCERLIGQN